MNYLAHIVLSGDNPMHLIGNFIGDAVKGKDYLRYKPAIATGIKLHRQIDSFMDTHPVVMQGKERLYGTSGKFAGVVIDVFYDYFLCKNWEKYGRGEFNEFVQSSYNILQQHVDLMPDISQFILGRMVGSNWLGHYPEIAGIQSALTGLSHRTRYKNNMANSVQDLIRYEVEFNREFNIFFPEIVDHCKTFIRQNGKT